MRPGIRARPGTSIARCRKGQPKASGWWNTGRPTTESKQINGPLKQRIPEPKEGASPAGPVEPPAARPANRAPIIPRP